VFGGFRPPYFYVGESMPTESVTPLTIQAQAAAIGGAISAEIVAPEDIILREISIYDIGDDLLANQALPDTFELHLQRTSSFWRGDDIFNIVERLLIHAPGAGLHFIWPLTSITFLGFWDVKKGDTLILNAVNQNVVGAHWYTVMFSP